MINFPLCLMISDTLPTIPFNEEKLVKEGSKEILVTPEFAPQISPTRSCMTNTKPDCGKPELMPTSAFVLKS